jgi:uncharacterized protein (TIGR02285 family)
MLKLLSVFFLLIFSPLICAEKLKIDWLLPNSPPFYISDNSDELGICEALVEKLRTSLPEVEHNLLIIPQARINKMMRYGEKVCFPCMIYRKQGNALATFSHPTVIYPPFAIAASINTVNQIKAKYGSPLDIKLLLNDHSFQLGRENARRFGALLQPILEQSHAYQNSALIYNSTESTTALINMIKKNRIDYIIEYPVNINYQKSIGNNSLAMIEIKQLKNHFIYGAIGCATSAKDNFGIKAISLINEALKNSILKDKEYIKYIKRWMSGSVVNYDEHYLKHIVKYEG